MFWFPTKKEVKKEFDKVRASFKDRDSKIKKLEEEIIELKKTITSKEEIRLMIDLMIKNYALLVKNEPNYELNQPNQTQFEKVMIQKAIKTRPEALKQTIRGLLERGLRTTDIYKIIVEEKRLINKTQFYHYLKLVRTELHTELRTELHTEPTQTKRS